MTPNWTPGRLWGLSQAQQDHMDVFVFTVFSVNQYLCQSEGEQKNNHVTNTSGSYDYHF